MKDNLSAHTQCQTQKGKCYPKTGIMDLFTFVGNRIREFRTYAGLSQEGLAKLLDVATNTISRWETATYKPSLEDLEKLSRKLGKSVLEFFPGDQPKQDERLSALLRAAQELDEDDLEELKRYAEFRRARTLMKAPAVGRPRKKSSKNDLEN